MNAVDLYRAQQLAIAAAIDSGDYGRASDLLRRDVREFARTQEQTGTTGHDTTLTAPTKCGIIKMIRRHVRRAIKSYRRAKTMTININLTQDAYISSGECRLHTDSGKPSAQVLHVWYEAAATDSDSNEYLVIWAIRDGWDEESGDESDACDWSNPIEIIRLDTGDNVTSRAKIEW